MLHTDTNDLDIPSKNIPMMPGKVITVVIVMTTEVALIHEVALVTLLLLCTLILKRFFLACQEYTQYKFLAQGFVKMTPF